MSRLARLQEYLLDASAHCRRPAVVRFAHPWIAPMPLTPDGAAFLRAHGLEVEPSNGGHERSTNGDGPLDVFNTGDYSLGLFHHDASEAAIELLQHEQFVDPCRGSLLNLLDNMTADGLVHRVELAHKSHEDEPSKPVIAQFALRCAEARPGEEGACWLRDHRVYERVEQFIGYLERHYVGKHGLFLAHSALQTGFDNDLLTVALPDKTIEDPGISAFMVLEYEAMARLAELTGRADEAPAWRARAGRVRFLMNELMWFETPEGFGFYVALRWQHGVAHLAAEIVSDRAGNALDPICTWVSLLPLYAGVPDEQRAAKLCALMFDKNRFWSPVGVRTLPRTSVYFNQSPRSLIYDYKVGTRTAVSNWQGPVWILSNYYMAEGLARYGHADRARDLALRTADLCLAGLESTGSLHECYDDAGRGLWPADGGFVSWNVLALTMLRRFAPDA